MFTKVLPLDKRLPLDDSKITEADSQSLIQQFAHICNNPSVQGGLRGCPGGGVLYDHFADNTVPFSTFSDDLGGCTFQPEMVNLDPGMGFHHAIPIS